MANKECRMYFPTLKKISEALGSQTRRLLMLGAAEKAIEAAPAIAMGGQT